MKHLTIPLVVNLYIHKLFCLSPFKLANRENLLYAGQPFNEIRDWIHKANKKENWAEPKNLLFIIKEYHRTIQEWLQVKDIYEAGENLDDRLKPACRCRGLDLDSIRSYNEQELNTWLYQHYYHPIDNSILITDHARGDTKYYLNVPEQPSQQLTLSFDVNVRSEAYEKAKELVRKGYTKQKLVRILMVEYPAIPLTRFRKWYNRLVK